jgi:hypothetical protein
MIIGLMETSLVQEAMSPLTEDKLSL